MYSAFKFLFSIFGSFGLQHSYPRSRLHQSVASNERIAHTHTQHNNHNSSTIMAGSPELAYDLDEAVRRQKISLTDLQRLREATVGIAPKDITDKQLALFLDSCGTVEFARKTIDTYYTVRKTCPEHFAGRDPNSPEIQQCLDNQ